MWPARDIICHSPPRVLQATGCAVWHAARLLWQVACHRFVPYPFTLLLATQGSVVYGVRCHCAGRASKVCLSCRALFKKARAPLRLPVGKRQYRIARAAYTEMVLKTLKPFSAVLQTMPGICGCQCTSLTSFWPCARKE